MPLTLKAHDFELGLAPELGGTVSFLRHQGQDLLRPTKPAATDPRDTAAFPLVPFSGRIENGAFTFQSNHITLPPNMPPEPHAIHGHGWQAPWTLADEGPGHATLRFEHPVGDWPWGYVAEQVFRVDSQGVRVGLSVTNTSDSPMPAGLGWHPYFPRGDARLSCDVKTYWPSDGSVPKPVSADFNLTTPKQVDAITLDNAFSAGGAPAQMTWPTRGIGLSLSASAHLTHWIVYIPEGEDYFCAEPVSHAPNALNMVKPPKGAEMQILAPGETMTASCNLKIVRF